MDIVIRSGCIVLENGGETYRTEATIVRMAKALGAKTASAFVTPTVIMFSYTDDESHYHSATKRIKHSTVNLQKVALINNLSRRLHRRKVASSPKQVSAYLKRIEELPSYSKISLIIGAAISSFSFAIMFGGSVVDAAMALIIGLMLRCLLIFLQKIPINNFLVSVTSGFFVSLVAQVPNLFLPNLSSSIIAISVLMQVVPGLAIVNGIRDLISGDLVSGTARILDAFVIAAALSIGSIPGLMLFSRIL